MYPIKVRMIYKYLTRKKLIMLLLSQRGQPQKWYNQYGNVRCNTVCQLFNQPTNGGKKRIRKSVNKVEPLLQPCEFYVCDCMYFPLVSIWTFRSYFQGHLGRPIWLECQWNILRELVASQWVAVHKIWHLFSGPGSCFWEHLFFSTKSTGIWLHYRLRKLFS